MKSPLIMGILGILVLAGLSAAVNESGWVSPQSDGGWVSPTSDNSYTPPKSDNNYVAPKSDNSYVAPKAGPGYQAVKSDSNYTSPTAGPGFAGVKSDGNYTSPTAGEGYVKPDTFNVSENGTQSVTLTPKNETQVEVVPPIVPPTEPVNHSKEYQEPKKDEPGNDPLNKWPFAGKYRMITFFRSYPDGNWNYENVSGMLLNIKDNQEWEYGEQKGAWAVYPIEDVDWQRWQVKSYGPKTKIRLNDPDGSFMEGPLEGKGLWIIYDEAGSNVQIRFDRALAEGEFPLTVKKIGAGSVVSSPEKTIKCGSACIKKFRHNTLVMLVALPDDGWTFSGWEGACTSQDSVCRVKMEEAKTVTARFEGACTDNSQCPLDQACVGGTCVQIDCACGSVNNHVCTAYECCSDTDCGEGKTCNLDIRACVTQSACQPVVINGDSAQKHDIVFVGAGFKSYENLEKGIRLLMDFDSTSQSKLGFFSLTPFKENKQKFNTWMVLAPKYPHYEEPSPMPQIVEKLLVPDESAYQASVQSCERDTVVVFSPAIFRSWAYFPTAGPSGGSVFMSLNNPIQGPEFLGRILTHELAHAIGRLGDEYIEYGGADRPVDDLPNCASTLEQAQAKWGDLVGIREVGFYTGIQDVPGTTYYKSPAPTFPQVGFFPDGSDFEDGGCEFLHKNIRPMISTIMTNTNTLDNDFGPVNERAINEKLEVYPSQDGPAIEAQGGRGRRFVEDAG